MNIERKERHHVPQCKMFSYSPPCPKKGTVVIDACNTKRKVNSKQERRNCGREPEMGLVYKAGPVSSSPRKRVMHKTADVPRLTDLLLLNQQSTAVTFPDSITVENIVNIWATLLALLM